MKVSLMPMGTLPSSEVKAALELAEADNRLALKLIRAPSASRAYEVVTSEEGVKMVMTEQVTEAAAGAGHPQGCHAFSLGSSEVRSELGGIVQAEHFASIFKHDESVAM